jgi:hypothetical protein
MICEPETAVPFLWNFLLFSIPHCIYANYQWQEQHEFINKKGGHTFKAFPENSELIQFKIHREL